MSVGKKIEKIEPTFRRGDLAAVTDTNKVNQGRSPAHSLYDRLAVSLTDDETTSISKWSPAKRIAFIIGSSVVLWGSVVALALAVS